MIVIDRAKAEETYLASVSAFVVALCSLEAADRITEEEGKRLLDALSGAFAVAITAFAKVRPGETVDAVLTRVMDEVFAHAGARVDAARLIVKIREASRRQS